MKKLFLIVPVFALVLSSCKTSQMVSYTDDVYSSPSDEKRLAKIAAAEKAKKEAEEKEQQEQSRLAQKAKDDANPYYKDPAYSADDYYDYQYASRVRRFGSPISGAGYYDNYYTNSYWYNQNPTCYGTSIYSSYNYLMPSSQFNNYYNNSLSFGMGYGYNNGYGYNPYCNNYGYNPYYGYGNSYNNGYYNGYNNGYYSGMYGYGYNPYNSYGYYGSGYYGSGSGWGYYNSQDVNSGYSHYGVRGSNGGGNSPRATSAGMAVPQEYSGDRAKLIEGVLKQQESNPRFTEVPRQKATISENNGSYTGPVKNGGNNPSENTGKPNNNNTPRGTSSQPYDYNSNSGNDGTKGSNSWNTYESPGINTNTNTNNGNTPRSNHGTSTKSYAPEKDDKTYGTSSEKSSSPGGWNSNGNSGSSTSSPRGGSSQNSGSRPR
jgi:hypothetical protein